MENEPVSIVEICWYLFSTIFLIRWLRQTGWGRRSLIDAPLKKHHLQVFDLLFVVFLYLAAMAAASVVAPVAEAEPDWRQKNLAWLIALSGYAILSAAILWLGVSKFEAGLPGLGVSAKGFGKTLWSGFGYFLVGGGLTLGTLFLTVQICRLAGYDIIQRHDILQMLEKNPPWTSLLILLFLPAVAAPIAEELLFRGLLQNFLIRIFTRNYAGMPDVTFAGEKGVSAISAAAENPPPDSVRARWLGILVTSLVFAVFHAQWQQWPALFVLSLVLGYSYERRGNLLICMFTHAFFNLLPLAMMLWKVHYGQT
ncbi:MAG: CAAX amino terminal protease self- immunity [Planctomycetes bacterium ADurb.Bin412]|nr:MAG: CAAX amino terminal protease self- immunity [Planctomycetes bacterium ADurb.Bin412]